MFVITLSRTSLKKLGLGAMCCALVVCSALLGRYISTRTVTAAASVNKIESAQDIQTWFTGYGLEVDGASITADKVKIPRKWDDSFSAFNGVVQQSGMDLTRCKGKTVEKWTALIPAASSGETSRYGVLLVWRKKAVGAYLLERPSGVVVGLKDRGIELVILGSGESQYESFFSDLCARHPGRVGTYIGFEPALSQEIYAGADAFIMPSKSEPCGLAQMVACRYGTPPIVRETGGLRDSIHDSTMGDGNGFTFAGYSAHELYEACCHAQDAYNNKENWHNLVHHCMECDFSWDVSAKSYEGLYNETANLW